MSCCVNFCKNRSDRRGEALGTGGRPLRFYRFPNDPKLRNLWIKAARRWDLLNTNPGPTGGSATRTSSPVRPPAVALPCHLLWTRSPADTSWYRGAPNTGLTKCLVCLSVGWFSVFVVRVCRLSVGWLSVCLLVCLSVGRHWDRRLKVFSGPETPTTKCAYFILKHPLHTGYRASYQTRIHTSAVQKILDLPSQKTCTLPSSSKNTASETRWDGHHTGVAETHRDCGTNCAYGLEHPSLLQGKKFSKPNSKNCVTFVTTGNPQIGQVVVLHPQALVEQLQAWLDQSQGRGWTTAGIGWAATGCGLGSRRPWSGSRRQQLNSCKALVGQSQAAIGPTAGSGWATTGSWAAAVSSWTVAARLVTAAVVGKAVVAGGGGSAARLVGQPQAVAARSWTAAGIGWSSSQAAIGKLRQWWAAQAVGSRS
ncbi:hypothetical protein WMY93_004121 [Mugilogobius chulae]|uniref:THAP-type domain-containing protein n=1 Tax=Mugilogobius chulae TaxID=88201 RepID=A0AAW0PU20_9GOBI